jgi:hypothetical protein
MPEKKPIQELLEEVRRIRSNLDRINKDLAFIKNKYKEEKEEKEEKDKYTILDNNKLETPSQRGWFF